MIHPIDALSGVALRFGPARNRLFRGGWGDDAAVDLLAVPTGLVDPGPVDVAWGSPHEAKGLLTWDGVFPSPAPLLPPWARRAHVRLVAPEGTTGGSTPAPDGLPVETDRVCLWMPAWNDHGYATRTTLAAGLAARGVASLILENAFYGARRPAHTGQPIHSVADFAVMGRAALEEGRSLLTAYRQGRGVGVAGFSMGGNLAAFVGASVRFPVAIAGLAVSHSPGPVFLDGVLRRGIDWGALGGPGARDRLRSRLTGASVLRLPPEPHTASAVLVGGTRDGYVPRPATEALHAHWPGSALHWYDAGHATLLWLKKAALVDAVEEAFDRLGTGAVAQYPGGGSDTGPS